MSLKGGTNRIPELQDGVEFLQKKAAEQDLSTSARRVYVLQFLLAVPSSIAWAFAAIFEPGLQVWASLFGLAVSFVDAAILEDAQKRFKAKAAAIQELYDGGLFGLPWATNKPERQPSHEVIACGARRYLKREGNYDRLKVWYPAAVGAVDLPIGALICQRMNCWWSSELRRRYIRLVLCLLVVFCVGAVVLSAVRDLTVRDLILSVLTPISPAVLWGTREFRSHKESADLLDKLKERAEDIWSDAVESRITAAELERQLRYLQDEIYESRKARPLVFQWVYRVFRPGQELEMREGAASLVKEVHERLSAGERERLSDLGVQE